MGAGESGMETRGSGMGSGEWGLETVDWESGADSGQPIAESREWRLGIQESGVVS
jgi:hypothetical protein